MQTEGNLECYEFVIVYKKKNSKHFKILEHKMVNQELITLPEHLSSSQVFG